MSSIGIDEPQLLLKSVEIPAVPAKSLSTERFERIVTLCEVVADLLTSSAAIFLAYRTYLYLQLGKRTIYPTSWVVAVALAVAVIVVLFLDREGAYRTGNSLLRIKETERVLRSSAQAFLVLFAFNVFVGLQCPRWGLVLSAGFLPVLLVSQKQAIYMVIRALHARRMGVRRVVIYGAGYTGRRVFAALTRSPKLGLDPVAIVDDEPMVEQVFEQSYGRQRSAPVLRGPLTSELLRKHGATMVIMAIPTLPESKFMELLRVGAAAGVNIAFVPRRSVPSELWIDYADIDGLLLGSISRPSMRRGYDFLKRTLDLVLGGLTFILCSPVLLLLAMLVRLDSAGPAIFRQKRVGRHGRLFDIYKFRSMYTDAPAYAYSPTGSEDPRVTRIGRFLRRTSLDELPQIFNVLKGDMSLVGPRPEMPFIVQRYNTRQRQRLEVKPGITGLWQLSADRAFLIHENIQYDLYYIRNRSLFMDLAILLHTFVFAMRGV